MRNNFQTAIKSAALLAVVALSAGVSGCSFLKPAKATARHYVLSPVSAVGSATVASGSIAVGLGKVKIPAYLFNTSLVVRKGTNEIEYLPSAFWAERLDSGFQRVLAANLAILLPTDRISLSAWQRNQVMAEVYVTLEQFDVDETGRGVLVARWRILSPGGDQLLKVGSSRLSRQGPVPDTGVSGAIDTLSQLVADFAVQLATALKETTSPPQAAPLSGQQEQGGGPPAQLAARAVRNLEQVERFVADLPSQPVKLDSPAQPVLVTTKAIIEAAHRISENINS